MPIVIDRKREELLATDGHIVVRGGAGSGKTSIALAKACFDLTNGRLGKNGKALFLSFARATVARVAEHATATIPKEHLARIEINTYHGFAWAILKSHAYLMCARDGVSLLPPTQARNRFAGVTGPEKSVAQRRLFDEEGLVPFDLFPVLLSELFAALPILARAYADAYPLILVDEFQDTNAEEWAMIAQLGRHSRLIALGDPKQRIYDFKGANPRRFDDFVAAFRPTPFDFQGENHRSPGTGLTRFADALLDGDFDPQGYAGVTIWRYPGQSLRPLKEAVIRIEGRNRRVDDWSMAILVPTNNLAVSVFNYMTGTEHGLPGRPVDIQVAAEGPMLAGELIALLLEPRNHDVHLGALILEGIAAFEVGRSETASATALAKAGRYRVIAREVRARGNVGLGRRGIGPDILRLLTELEAVQLSGDPVRDWLAVRALFASNVRKELQDIAQEARHMRLFRRGTQIEGRFAEAWRAHGEYRDARSLLNSAFVEDQFSATTKPHRGVTVMTIHKAKGKEFDDVVVYESPYRRYLKQNPDAAAISAARFNLHVAATRARRGVTIATPAISPCPLLP